MKFLSVRIIVDDIKSMVSFYEKVLSVSAKWSTEDFAEITSDAATLAIGSKKTLAFFGADIAVPASNKSAILEFLVDNVDDRYEMMREAKISIVQAPTTMPWKNRSLLFRDHEGNLINFFTPVSDGAKKKFGI